MGGTREVWLAAGALSAFLTAQQQAHAQNATTDPIQAGVAGRMNPNVTASRAGFEPRRINIGDAVFMNERVATGPDGRVQLMLLDRTSLTVGPNAELLIDRFIYDPDRGTGELAISALQGVFRLVGGELTKNNAATVRTPVATIGIRGGIGLFNVGPDGTVQAIFVFGEEMTVTNEDGTTETVTRPGFMVTVTPDGGITVAPAPADLVANLMAQLQNQQGQGGQDTVTVTTPAIGGDGDTETTFNTFPFPPGASGQPDTLSTLQKDLGLGDDTFERLRETLDRLGAETGGTG